MGSSLHDTRLFASRKVKLCRHFASMSEKFLYYATTHRTMLHAERNDCVHPAYFSFRTSVLRVVRLRYGNVLLTPTVTFKLLLNHMNCQRLAQRGYVLICSCKIKSGELTESTCRSSSGNVNNKFLLNIAQVQQSSNRTF